MNPPATSLPEVLFHYCPTEAMVQVLQSRVLWLTHQSGLNDRFETVWAVPFIQAEIQQRRTSETTHFFDEVRRDFDSNKSEVFVASFSSAGDVLSQWRAYAQDGEGVAIGFRTTAFRVREGIPMTSFVPDHTVGYVKVHYDDIELKRWIGLLLDQHLQRSAAGRDALHCAFQLRSLALAFKNPAFKEEDEWRITYSPLITSHQERRDLEVEGMLKDIRFRASQRGILPYFEMPFDGLPIEDAVAEIVLGPKCRSNSGLVHMLLLSLGYRNAVVRRSAASYR